MTPKAHPLTWPSGWPRARRRKPASFHERANDGFSQKQLSLTTALDRLESELGKLGAKEIILSTNRERRLNGMISAAGSEPDDPGVAVYFNLKGRATALACDTWTRVADNVNAIAKHIEAIRGMDRWGVGTVDQVFTGYQALPAPEQWWQVLGVKADASPTEVYRAFRDKASAAHPDKGGTNAEMARLNWAHDEARKVLGS